MNSLIYIGIGLLGVIVFMIITALKLQKLAIGRKIDFDFKKDYLEKDYLSIALSVVAVLVWVTLLQETMNAYPKIEGYIRWSFFGVGLTGSFLLQLVFGRAKGYIINQIDEKTKELEEFKNSK